MFQGGGRDSKFQRLGSIPRGVASMPYKTPEHRRAARRRYYELHREQEKQRMREWRLAHPVKFKELSTRARLLREYGITPETYAVMLKGQFGRCALCSIDPSPKCLHVDHCHATGRVRGLLCAACNRGLGMFRDEPGVLLRAAEYVRSYSEPSENLCQT